MVDPGGLVVTGGSWYTMLQKLSKCEVKAWLCRSLIILLPLRFNVKWNFGEFKRSKNVIFENLRDSKLWILVHLALESCFNLLKSKFRESKIAKNDIFWPFEHSHALTSHFENFWSIVWWILVDAIRSFIHFWPLLD